jgi:transcriptional regulator with XRE-family HTH domain
MNKLQALLNQAPTWLRRYHRKYQTDAVFRMMDLIEASGWTQKQVAQKAGWSEAYLSRILSGRENLTFRTMARFEEAVGGEVFTVVNAPQPMLTRVLPSGSWIIPSVPLPNQEVDSQSASWARQIPSSDFISSCVS